MGSAVTPYNCLLIESTGEIYDDRNNVRYEVGPYLGRGGFARCYEVSPRGSSRRLAAKVVSIESLTKTTARCKLVNEIRIQGDLQHPNVVKMYDHFRDDLNVYCIMELCHNGTLNDIIRRRRVLSEEETRFFIGHLVEGMKYLRDSNIIHRDIKPANLFISSNMALKIGDFGLAIYDNDKRGGSCGTPNYMAPEVLDKKEYSFGVDVWALGCVVYCMLVGRPPFDTGMLDKTSRRIKRGSYSLPSHLSAPAKTLISSMLKRRREDRIRVHEVQNMEFFNVGHYPTSLPEECLMKMPVFEKGNSVGVPPEAVLDDSTGVLYSIERYLHNGKFGNIYSISAEEGETRHEAVVIDRKRISQTHGLQERIVSEMVTLATLGHSVIVDFVKHLADANFIYLLYEPCIAYPLSRLLKRRRRLCEEEARYYINQIADGLRYLHLESEIVHGDISTDSICVSFEMNVKICNFGLAVTVDQGANGIYYGIPKHPAPEFFGTGYSCEVDLWALGFTLYELLTGKDLIKVGRSLSALDISTSAADIIERLTDNDREKRLKVEELPRSRFFHEVSTIATVSSAAEEQSTSQPEAAGDSEEMNAGCSTMATPDQLHEQFIASQRCGRRNALVDPEEVASADPGAFKLADALQYASIGDPKTASDSANEVSTDSGEFFPQGAPCGDAVPVAR
ncbi:hypothetical protein QR680_017311 [Steinernema hermaphroditum]|uniref:Protein kinase domain-containing protein n=1 Tax=Steinernema hermaphroditum TaxID=289476 RepID=A0AA39LNW9_9BILA|nr:hypothetical protein QR680_017311 [Steinernema hermaphroditum]